MRKLILLLILLSIAVATPISAEEIRLTTIVPDQTTERSKRGAIGETWSNPGTVPDGSIPASGILVEGKVGIGTTAPGTTLDVNGAVSVRGMSAPDPSPTGQGRIYFDSGSNKFQASENGGAYGPLGGGGGGAFGQLEAKAWGTVYQASTDGFVHAGHGGLNGWGATVSGRTDSANPPTTLVAYNYTDTNGCSIMFPVRKNNYWKVNRSATQNGDPNHVYWMPIQ